MKTKFVKTSNVGRFLSTVAALEDRGAPEASMALVQSQAGYGKTRTSQWWAQQTNAVHLRIQESMTPAWFFRDLVNELGGVMPANRVEHLFNQVVGILAKEPRPIVIDEVDRAIKNISILENIRDISDLLEITVILVGREYTWGSLRRHSQIKTRISARTDFQPATFEDVQACFAELCEVPVSEDVLRRVHHECDGHIREIVTAIKNVERVGFRSKGSEVTADMVKDKQLCQEVVASNKKRRAA